jgi:hypothetical protein
VVAVLSTPVRPALEPIAAAQQAMLAAVLLLALLGLALGLVREPAVPSLVPPDLAGAAERIARGDFDARVPRMSGTFGILASALARASEAARLARIGRAATAAPGPVRAGRPPPPPSAAPRPAATPGPSVPVPTLDVPLLAVPPDEVTGSHLPGESLLAPPGTPAPLPLEAPRGRSPIAVPAVQVAQDARAAHPRTTPPAGEEGPAAPAPAEDMETAWREVYEEFLQLRAANGEPTEGVTWERFRDKLRKNRDLLVQRYACRTVRFQVHDKEGRAALRATPVH